MRIILERSGGFAYLPGRTHPIVVDTETLGHGEATELETLVQRAGLLQGPLDLREPDSSGAVDGHDYRITVHDGADVRSVGVRDPLPDHAIASLIDYLTLRRPR